jgi:hypothetical protein
MYVGRRDEQVKLRGLRVEMEEVRVALLGHESIRECVVLLREDKPGAQQLVAYIVSIDGAMWSKDLRDFLEAKLPEHMIPSNFVFLDALPLTPNGKVDYRALPEPQNLRPESKTILVEPETEVEKIIAAIWRSSLQIDRVGVNDNFFELGGHSLLLLKVHRELQGTFADLSVMDLFKHPTIGELARRLGGGTDGSSPLKAGATRARSRIEALKRRERTNHSSPKIKQ